MANLNKTQKKVLDELFEGKKNERGILADNGISDSVYNRWLKEEAWKTAFQYRVDEAERRAQVAIAVYKPNAAKRLIELAGCEKEATSRQACLDIMNMPNMGGDKKDRNDNQKGVTLNVTDEMATKLLEAMAKVEKA